MIQHTAKQIRELADVALDSWNARLGHQFGLDDWKRQAVTTAVSMWLAAKLIHTRTENGTVVCNHFTFRADTDSFAVCVCDGTLDTLHVSIEMDATGHHIEIE